MKTTNAAPLQRGFSLIELLVSMVIGMVVTIAITSVMVDFNRSKRTSTASNDASLTGSYVTYTLDRTLRNAGSGFARGAGNAFGCVINANLNGAAVLPRTSPFPAPFDNLAGTALSRRLIPVLIEQGAANTASETRGDVITVMAGSGGVSEVPQRVTATSVTATDFRLANTLGWRGGDLVLLADRSIAGGCLIEEVSAGFTGSSSQTLTLNTTVSPTVYYTPVGSTVSLVTFGTANPSFAIQLGNPTLNNPPQFMMYAVGNDATLQSYDLLRLDNPSMIAEGIVEMRALYGVDTTGDHVLDGWRDPGTAPFDAATLTNGSAASLTNLQSIVAVRLGFVLRSSLREKDPIQTNPTLTLFSDLGTTLQRTRTLGTEERHYRHRTVEMTVPLQNMLIQP